MLERGALGYMPFGGRRIEAPTAVRTLHVVGILGRRRWRQIGQLAAARQMHLHLFGTANGRYEFLVLAAPVVALGRRRCGGRQLGDGGGRNGRTLGRHRDALRAQLLLDERLGLGALDAMRGRIEDLALLGGRLLADAFVLLETIGIEETAADAAAGHVVVAAGRIGFRVAAGGALNFQK